LLYTGRIENIIVGPAQKPERQKAKARKLKREACSRKFRGNRGQKSPCIFVSFPSLAFPFFPPLKPQTRRFEIFIV
jgi:hypothetical protein